MKGAFSRRCFRTRKRECSKPRFQSSDMQKFLSNLLMFFALSLCALCVFQWVRESRLRSEIADLHRTVYLKLESIQNLESQLKQTKDEVTRLDNLRVELNGIIKTNKDEIQSLTKYSEKLEKEIDANKAQIAVYKDAVEKANENIRRQNEDIKKQNEDMKQLAADRNATVEKYNKVVEQYNDLVKQFETFQQDA